MRIIIDVVKKEECRNGDVADYFYEGEDLIIKVTSTGNKFYDRAIAIHELSELSFLESKGVPFSVVDDFDKKCFEENKNEIA
jgi:DNA-binding transcriptional MerR regulator